MRNAGALGCLIAFALAGAVFGACSSEGDPSSSSSGTSGTGPTPTTSGTTPVPTDTTTTQPPVDPPIGAAPRAVKVAKTTAVPVCTVHVDGANTGTANGGAATPYKTIAAAVTAAAAGAIICVAQGTYAEKIAPGTKYFTLAGGFQTGKDFKVRDSSVYVTKAQGDGTGSFVRIVDPAPTAAQLTAIDGFEITGYSQGIYRDVFYAQKLDITNNYIHDNACQGGGNGGGFALNNVSGTITGNVIAKNSCGRGGGGSLDDSTSSSTVTISNNLVEGNSGTEAVTSHGGGLYLFGKTLTINANEFKDNTVTGWGAGMFVGADTGQGVTTAAALTWNVYRGNKAGIAGGGLFCDDSATCNSDHELYDKNCGGNIYLDGGPVGAGATVGTFDHLTNVNALAVGCGGPGNGVQIDKANAAADAYTFTNAIFFGNAPNRDFAAACSTGCGNIKVDVKYSNVQTTYQNGGVGITFGAGNVAPVDPQFVDAATGDFHLKSKNGHWAATTYTRDTVDSPALKAGDPAGAVSANPPRAGDRSELGTYGNSVEASYVR